MYGYYKWVNKQAAVKNFLVSNRRSVCIRIYEVTGEEKVSPVTNSSTR